MLFSASVKMRLILRCSIYGSSLYLPPARLAFAAASSERRASIASIARAPSANASQYSSSLASPPRLKRFISRRSATARLVSTSGSFLHGGEPVDAVSETARLVPLCAYQVERLFRRVRRSRSHVLPMPLSRAHETG